MSGYWAEEFSFSKTDANEITQILGTDLYVDRIEELVGMFLGQKKLLIDENIKPGEAKEYIEKIGEHSKALRDLLNNPPFSVKKDFDTKLALKAPNIDLHNLCNQLAMISAVAVISAPSDTRGRPKDMNGSILTGLAGIWREIHGDYPIHKGGSGSYEGKFYDLVRLISHSAKLSITDSSTKTFLLSLPTSKVDRK